MIDTQGIIDRICAVKVVAILRGIGEDKLFSIADALYEGGIRAIECTYDHARSDCVEANAAMIAKLVSHVGAAMDVGAGTVLTVGEVDACLQAGGTFIISPNVNPEVIAATRKRGAVSMPGALTPTEIVAAWEAGAHFVKIFPASNFGPDYIKAIRAPLKHIPMLAVGGITPENIPAYTAAGVSGFGIGSPLLPKEAVASGDWKAIAARAKAFVTAAGGAV